jgi:hypothetical protein
VDAPSSPATLERRASIVDAPEIGDDGRATDPVGTRTVDGGRVRRPAVGDQP